MGICLHIVLGNGLLRVVRVKDFVSCLDSYGSLGIAPVVHSHVHSVLLARLKVCQFLGHGHLAVQLHHRVAVLALGNLGCTFSTLVPVRLKPFLAGVKTCVHDVHSLAPGYIEISFLSLAHYVWRLGFSMQCELTAHHINSLLFCLAQVCQLVYFDRFQALPIPLQFPGCFAPLGIPVIELLLICAHFLTCLRIPVPGEQIGLCSSLPCITSGYRSLGDYHTVQGHSPVSVGRIVWISTASCHFDHICLAGWLLWVFLQSDLLLRGPGVGLAVVCHLYRVAVLPVYHLVVLEEFCHQVVGVQVGDVGVIVVSSLPSLKVLHVVSTKERCVGHAAVAGIIAYPGVFLMIPQETHHLTVFSLGRVSAVCEVCRPVLESRIVLIARPPLRGHPPAVVRDHLGELARLPGVLISAGCQVAPHIHIDKVHIVPDLLLQGIKTLLPLSAAQVVKSVNTNPLVQPVPAIAQGSCIVSPHQILTKSFGLRIHLAGIYMDTKSRPILGSFFHESVHVLRSAQTIADIVIIRMTGIMTFAGISFEQDRLAEAICVHSHPFYIVKSSEEGVLGLASKVHGNTPGHQLRHFFTLVWVVHDIPESDSSILPVHRLVLIHIPGDRDRALGHLCLFHRVCLTFGISNIAVIIPLCARKPQRCVSCPGFCRGVNTCVLASTIDRSCDHAPLMLGITPHAGAQLCVRDKSIHVISVGHCLHAICDFHILIAALMRVRGHDSAFQIGPLLGRAHRYQAVVGNSDSLQGIGLHLLAVLVFCRLALQIILDLCDIKFQVTSLHCQLGCDDRIDMISIILHCHGINSLVSGKFCLYVLRRYLQVHSVYPQGMDCLCLPIEGFSLHISLHLIPHNTREIFCHEDIHLFGRDRLCLHL